MDLKVIKNLGIGGSIKEVISRYYKEDELADNDPFYAFLKKNEQIITIDVIFIITDDMGISFCGTLRNCEEYYEMLKRRFDVIRIMVKSEDLIYIHSTYNNPEEK